MLGIILLSLLVIVLMVGLNALYVAGEFSTVSVRKTRIAQLAEAGNPIARLLLPVLEDRHRLDSYIAASQVGITLSSVALGIYGQQQIAPRLAPVLARLSPGAAGTPGGNLATEGSAAVIVLLFLTTLQVVFGELLPKSLALQYPERVALATTLPMRWSADYLLKPLIVLLNGSGSLLLRLLNIRHGDGHTHVHSPEEILILVDESLEGGLLDEDKHQLLSKVFQVTKTRADEIARARPTIVAAEVGTPLIDILRLATNSSFTRIPIYDKDIDHIIGFVHLKDLFRLYRESPQGDVRSILRPVPYVPETLPGVEVWNRLNEEKSYLAIVFDEYGGTSGLISREDLIEELFGELQDEFDQESEPITLLGDGYYLVRGDATISQLNFELELDLPHEEFNTIAGLVLNELGRMPQVGDTVEVQGVRLRVESVAGLTIKLVHLTLPEANRGPVKEETG